MELQQQQIKEMLEYEMPCDLSDAGMKAYEIITKVMAETGVYDTSGGVTFYSSEKWFNNHKEYNKTPELIVTYDGSAIKHLFSADTICPSAQEAMRESLREEQFYWEECTNWYSAIYKI